MKGCIAIQEWFYKFYEKENAHTIVMLQGICKQTAQTVWIREEGFEENTWNADVGIYLIWLKGLFSFWEDTTKGATSETNFKSSWQSWKNNYTTNIYLFTVLNMMTMTINNFTTPLLRVEKNILLYETVEGLAGTEAWNLSRAISPFQLSPGKYGADDTKYNHVTRQIQRKHNSITR